MRKLLAAFMFIGMATGVAVAADDKSADDIIKAIEAVKDPALDRSKVQDQAYVQAYLKERQEANAKRGELIGDLMKKDISHPLLAKHLMARWQGMVKGPSDFPKVISDASEIRSKTKNDEVKALASFVRSQLTIQTSKDPAAALAAAEDFIKDAPKDPRAAAILGMAADAQTDNDKGQALRKRVLADYPNSPAARSMKGAIKQAEGVGKPFELEFTDAIKGSTISMAGLKGKVVVIDFWATWCGPCIAEMPKMKKLYAEYKEKGVEFIGVSLDQPKDKGGLDALKKYVEENKIEWPQYYQGNYWQSEFSSGWGINSIPCVFIVDAEGKLHSVKARGKLEEMIPELLKKAKAGKS